MGRKVNGLDVDSAQRFNIPIPGGSDAYILQEIGSVITGVQADSIGEFLDGIRKCESIVVGSAPGIVLRGMTAGVIAYHYVPCSVTALRTSIGPHTTRLRHSMRRFFRPP